MAILQDLKKFILHGNVVDLAVGVVMGAAFGAVVTSLVKDLITPIIAAIFGQPKFSKIAFTIHGSVFQIGDFINSLISFVLIGISIFFFIVLPVNKLVSRYRNVPAPDPNLRKCPECLSDMPVQARRCAHCASLVQPQPATAPGQSG